MELTADRRSVASLEYAAMAGVLVVVVLTAAVVLGSGMSNVFNSVVGKL
jgi:Flp pilus assembly pilin Flp